jgi:hypothetical protein
LFCCHTGTSTPVLCCRSSRSVEGKSIFRASFNVEQNLSRNLHPLSAGASTGVKLRTSQSHRSCGPIGARANRSVEGKSIFRASFNVEQNLSRNLHPLSAGASTGVKLRTSQSHRSCGPIGARANNGHSGGHDTRDVLGFGQRPEKVIKPARDSYLQYSITKRTGFRYLTVYCFIYTSSLGRQPREWDSDIKQCTRVRRATN